jgi:hypothetical protein
MTDEQESNDVWNNAFPNLNTNIQYHKFFVKEKFCGEAVDAVKKCIQSGLFKNDIQAKKKLLFILHKKLCAIYAVKICLVEFNETSGFEHFDHENNIISTTTSLVSYLHEFAHYLFFNNVFAENNEENARGFSHGLYYNATPKLFKSAVEKGLIVWQSTFEE